MTPRTLAAALLAAAVAGFAAPATAGPAQTPACTDAEIGVLAPFTGNATFLAAEQLTWVRYAVSEYNDRFDTDFSVRTADSELDAAAARTAARELISAARVLGVVGASTSAGVIATGPLLANASLASVSGSATRPDLTTRGLSSFFRVVPHDDLQAPAIVELVTRTLGAKRVLVAAGKDARSVALAGTLERLLRSRGVRVDRAAPGTAVARTEPRTDLVVFATTDAEAADALAARLAAAGKRAPLLATDAHAPDTFKPRSGYTTSFAADLRFRAAAKEIVDGYRSFARRKEFGTFGPPSYDAAWVLLAAIDRACDDGRATRAEVLERVRATNVPSVRGGRIRFTTAGETLGARFVVYKVANGTYSPAARTG